MYYGNNFGFQFPQNLNPTSYYNPAANSYPNYQPQQQPKINTNKIFVSGIEDVKMRVLDPNSDFIFFDNEKSMIYRKVVDGTGHFEVKAFDVIEHKEAEKQPNAAQPLNPQEFVRKEEFEALQNQINALAAKINTEKTEAEDGFKL